MKPRWQLRARVCNNTVAKHPTEGRPAASANSGFLLAQLSSMPWLSTAISAESGIGGREYYVLAFPHCQTGV